MISDFLKYICAFLSVPLLSVFISQVARDTWLRFKLHAAQPHIGSSAYCVLMETSPPADFPVSSHAKSKHWNEFYTCVHFSPCPIHQLFLKEEKQQRWKKLLKIKKTSKSVSRHAYVKQWSRKWSNNQLMTCLLCACIYYKWHLLISLPANSIKVILSSMAAADFSLIFSIWCEDNWMKSWVSWALTHGPGSVKRGSSVLRTALPALFSCSDLSESLASSFEEKKGLNKWSEYQTWACKSSAFKPAVQKEVCQIKTSVTFSCPVLLTHKKDRVSMFGLWSVIGLHLTVFWL